MISKDGGRWLMVDGRWKMGDGGVMNDAGKNIFPAFKLSNM
jgi:hypothetical protein